jgi:hypothetical protein
MKRTVGTLVILMLVLTLSAYSYSLEWASVCPGDIDLYPHDNITDASGNVYNTGRFRGTVDFDPGVGVSSLTANGFTDAFIQKLDPAGNFLWVINLTGGSWEQLNGITTDGAGNIYAFGHFGGTVDFDPGPGVLSLTSNGGNDLVVIKLSTAGNLIWAKSIGAASSEEGLFIGCDATGNIYCGGLFYLSVDFDPGPGTASLTSTGGQDVCIFKWDPSGNYLWAVSFGTSTSETFGGMDVSNAGDVIIIGSFTGSGDFNPNAGVNTLTAIAFSDVFFVKINNLGNHLWSSSIGSPGFDFTEDVCFTAGGDMLIVGGFNSAIDFDPGPGTVTLTPVGLNGYVLNLDPTGNFLWVKHLNGFSMLPSLVEVNPVGKIFLIGAFKGTVDFDPGPGVVSGNSSNIQTDAFALRLDNTGAYEWHLDPEGTINFDQLFAMTISTLGHVFFMGRFTTGTIDLLMGPGVMSVTNATPGDFGNGFFFKLNAGSPLPVEWGAIEAFPSEKKVEIKWTTLAEINNDYFEIERSYDGFQWTVIGRTKAIGISNQLTDYKYYDYFPKKGINYYRIRQTDFNGTTELSKTIAVRFSNETQETIHLTHLQNATSLLLWSSQNLVPVCIEIFTPEGRLLQKIKEISLPAEIDLYSLPSQLLYIRVSYNSTSTTLKYFRQ